MRREHDTSGIHLWLLMMKAHHALSQVSLRSIANTGMCFTDFAILEALLHKGPLPVNTVAPLVNLTSGSMTTAVDRLEKRGFVRRMADAEDRRTRVVNLTAEGREMIEQVFRQHSGDMEEVAGVLTDAERETLARLLKKLGMHAASLPAGGNTAQHQTLSTVRPD